MGSITDLAFSQNYCGMLRSLTLPMLNLLIVLSSGYGLVTMISFERT